MKHLLAALTCAIVLNACHEAKPDITPNDAEIIETPTTPYSGPFWAALMAYSVGFDETHLGIGPFLSEGECRERLIAELLTITDEGGSASFAECVLSDEKGVPLEPIALPKGRAI